MKWSLLIIIFALSSTLHAQRTLSGMVKYKGNGEAIFGVSISIKGTSIGTISNMEGMFTLDIPDGLNDNEIRFSYAEDSQQLFRRKKVFEFKAPVKELFIARPLEICLSDQKGESSLCTDP